jgi:phospholipase/carboxylesterase
MIPASNVKLPIFLAHGVDDQVIPFELAKASLEFLNANGFEPDFKAYPGLAHSVSMQELQNAHDWLQTLLSKNANM